MLVAFNLITVNQSLLTRIGDRCKCIKCGIEFKIGDKVFSHQRQNRKILPLTEYFCKPCKRGLYI